MVKDGGLMSHKLDVLSMESKVEKKNPQKYMDIAKRQNKKKKGMLARLELRMPRI